MFPINLLHRILTAVLPSRKTAGRIVFLELFALGWLLAAFFAHQQYVVTCSAGGHFTAREQCGQLAQNQADSQELARQAFVSANQDVMK